MKDFPKTLFSIFSLSHHIRFLPLFPYFSTPFPLVYVDFTPYPFGSIPMFENYSWKRLETQTVELQDHFRERLRWPTFRKGISCSFYALVSSIYFKTPKKICYCCLVSFCYYWTLPYDLHCLGLVLLCVAEDKSPLHRPLAIFLPTRCLQHCFQQHSSK